jgi:type I restriction enzyme R subunit
MPRPLRIEYENAYYHVMNQMHSNTPEQAMLGDFPKAVDDAVLDSNTANLNQMMQLLSNPDKAQHFSKIMFYLLQLKE